MDIKTKYEIGQHIWVVYEHQKEVHVYDDCISSIVIDDDGMIYGTKETYEEYKEEEIILYEETEKLVEKIKKITEEIREKEKNEKEE